MMKRTLIGAVLMVAASAVFATDLKVIVKNPAGQPIAGARVIAVRFGPEGPDNNSRGCMTDANGEYNFQGAGVGGSLATTNEYDIFAATQGYLPSISDQFNDP